ncbi:MAG TPA: S53 family peptidase [Solirubrobacteraceae bacterium]|nr:S53 family peptidase [Solirubrobacteraceae bacterium]
MASAGKLRTAIPILLGAVLGLGLGTTPALAGDTAPRSLRVGHAPSLPHGSRVLAPLAAETQLQLTVALRSQDPSGLAGFAEAVSTPSSPLFRQYLGSTEFAQRFGATPAQIALVRSQLDAQGLAVGEPAANDLSLPIRATATQVERAFSVSLSHVELADGRSAYANAQAPSIPAAAAPYVQGVIGLEDISLDQPQGIVRGRLASALPAGRARQAHSASPRATPLPTGGPEPCLAARKAAEELGDGGETADEVATAYQLPSFYQAGDLGAGQTIAVFEQEAYDPFDIDSYQACYSTNASVTNVDVDGGPAPFEGGDTEAALDIEQIIGLAPQAHVLVYQGPIEQKVAPADILSRIVSDDSAKVISSSWGLCEAFTFLAGAGVVQFENTLLQEAAVQGQSFFAASGDSGSEQCEQIEPEDTELAVNNPASQPFATGVGGTSLFSRNGSEAVRYDGTLAPIEGVWNNGKRSEGLGGSGGGLSEVWAMPSYQSSAGAIGVISAESSSLPCGRSALCREVPDVAASADPNKGYVVHVGGEPPNGGWTLIGGTSAAAPLWAAFTGLANASPACSGVPIGFANPSLYAIASSSYAGNFRDVVEPSPTTGRANNNTTFGVGPFAVTVGYDMTTGLGAPLGSTLGASLCAIATRPASPPSQAIAPPTTPQPAPAPAPTPAPTIDSTQIKARLLAQIIPSGKGAKIASLLKLGSFSLAFNAPEPGSLTIGWYELPTGAKLARKGKPKPVLVATGRLRFPAAGRRTVRLELTRAGRVLLERHKRFVLTAKGTFTPAGKQPIVASKRFVLKR